MKKYLINPHLMLMGLFVLIIVSSSLSLRAQVERKIVRSIIITNGDTIVNGQKLSEANKENRIRLRKELLEMEQERGVKSENSVIIRKNNGKEPLILNWNENTDEEIRMDLKNGKIEEPSHFYFDEKNMNIDSLLNGFNLKIDGLDSNLRKRVITMHRNFRPGQPGIALRTHPDRPTPRSLMPAEEQRRSSSSFIYNHMDQDGILSRMNIRISDIEKENLEKITGSKESISNLKVEDLTIFPNFSTGKMGLSFNLSRSAPLKIKILNSDFKQVFTDEVSNFNENYTKQISLPKNGMYYIAIKQNNNWFLRKLIKS
jgi:hypothetical protein